MKAEHVFVTSMNLRHCTVRERTSRLSTTVRNRTSRCQQQYAGERESMHERYASVLAEEGRASSTAAARTP
jgi:hypothetical protein